MAIAILATRTHDDPAMTAQACFAFDKPRKKRASRKRATETRRRRVRHVRRPDHDRRHPVHVTLSLVDDVGYLRRPEVRRVVQDAMTASICFSRTREAFRICELSIQGRHLHLVAEAESRAALSRGIQGFKISVAKRLNALLSRVRGALRKGAVFADRFHARALRTPREVRAVLAYVLNNWRHHGASVTPGTAIDPYSTGITFGGWKDASPIQRFDKRIGILPVWIPRTWLLRDGWQGHGLVRTYEVPGR
jgi:putative transposase